MLEHSLETLWYEATTENKAANVSSSFEEAYLYKGIRIAKRDDNIKIYNTRKAGMNYKEITDEQYYEFLQNGFRKGAHIVLQSTYKEQIDKINAKIQGEVNSRNNKKHFEALKNRREFLINKYSNLNK